ncbi:hypothetical protein BM527_16660 [Alteromonas sp. Mex14]|nr:hypothetical protein BM527_16660 [Alteromonas sp. Mex14]
MNFPFPNLFIPGVQKAGTTALSSFLAQHPEICLVKGKEAHVFDDPEYHKAKDKVAYAKAKYASKLKHYNDERYILDATPITMLHPAFIKAASTTCPEAKYLVMLRDPVERALSHYAMTKSRGLEPYPHKKAFLTEPWRMRGFYKALPNEPFESKFRDQSYLIRGRYKQQLNALYKYSNSGNVRVIQQQQLQEKHQTTLNDIFDFLEVDRMQIPHKSVFNTKEKKPSSIMLKWALYAYFKLLDR